MELQSSFPLRWPDGIARTPFQARKIMTAWKWTAAQSTERLVRELKLLGSTSALLTRNPPDHTEDSGVAVWLSLKPINDYAWQEALGFIGEVPTIQQIDRAYMERARALPRRSGDPDPDLLMALTKHRDRARAWARGERTVEHEKCLSVDAFKEQRWNINAIRLTISALRQIERCGSALMVEQAWRGFSKQITAGAAKEDHAVETVA